MWWIWHLFQIFLNFGSSHFLYLLKLHIKLNGQKWVDGIEQINSEKNQRFLVLNDKCFFICWVLIPEQILRLHILLITFFHIYYRFHGLMGCSSKMEYIYIYIYIYIYWIFHRVYFFGKCSFSCICQSS